MAVATDFSTRLRERTATDHRQAEHSALMAAIMAGTVSARDYVAMLRQLEVVYAALEWSSRRHSSDPAYTDLFDQRLERTAAIRQDITRFSDSNALPPVGQTAHAYARRIEAIADQPHLVLAHHYTRHLGDLSGGVVLGARVSAALKCPTDLPPAFFDSSHLGPLGAYKRNYRMHLDDLRLTTDQESALVAEVHVAYGFNTQVFDEVELSK